MSLTYEVAVPQGKWPTFADMNAAFERHGYPMKALVQGGQKLGDPMKEFVDKNIYNFTGTGGSSAENSLENNVKS